MSTASSPNSLRFGSYSSPKLLYQSTIASSDSEPSSPSWTPSATSVRQMAPVRRRRPRSSGRRRWHGRHGAPHSLSARPFSSSLSLSHSLWRKRRRHCRRELRQLLAPSPLRLASPPSASKSASSSSIFSTISWTRSPRGERHFASSPSSGSRQSRHRFRRTSPLLHPCFLLSG